ncbi:MAG: hypothetical protein K0U64_05340 [Actinomycetia bacterium]|nr:hypothetical protein [Actinomycetes bacterium]
MSLSRHEYTAGHWGAATGASVADSVLVQWHIRAEITRIRSDSQRKILLTVGGGGAVFLPFSPSSRAQLAGWYVPAALTLATLVGISVADADDTRGATVARTFRIDPDDIFDQVKAGRLHQAVVFAVEPRHGPAWNLYSVRGDATYWGWREHSGAITLAAAGSLERNALLSRIARPQRPNFRATRPSRVCEKNVTVRASA